MPETTPVSSTATGLPYSFDYPPTDFIDPVIEAYKKDVDLTIVRENLKLTMEERLRKAQARAVERAASDARLEELNEFHQFTSRLLEVTTAPLTLDEYLKVWRESQEWQSSLSSIRQGIAEDEAGLSLPLAEAFDEVRSLVGIKK